MSTQQKNNVKTKQKQQYGGMRAPSKELIKSARQIQKNETPERCKPNHSRKCRYLFVLLKRQINENL